MPRFRFALITLAAAMCLGACGTKGPLYTPSSLTATTTTTTTSVTVADDNSRTATTTAA